MSSKKLNSFLLERSKFLENLQRQVRKISNFENGPHLDFYRKKILPSLCF